MTPAHRDDAVTIYIGDAREVLDALPADSVDCVVTSPPYWGLRDYGLRPTMWGGDASCRHRWGPVLRGKRKDLLPSDTTTFASRTGTGASQGRAALQGGRFCQRCGAWEGSLGLEPMPELYVEHLVDVLRRVRRVLAPHGTMWLVLGDGYAGTGIPAKHLGLADWSAQHARGGAHKQGRAGALRRSLPAGLKRKDLVGIPWRTAFALQADGWYLRSDIVWAKPNPTPESVRDRPTRAHEYVFLLARCATYFYDSEAIREPTRSLDPTHPSYRPNSATIAIEGRREYRGKHAMSARSYNLAGRNRRTVWDVATQPYGDEHFATFPERLVEPCILAGTSQAGRCQHCGAPWRRVVEVTYANRGNHRTNGPRSIERRHKSPGFPVRLERRGTTVRWEPTCECGAEPAPTVVLDPFAGSGTTLAVAARLGRRAVGIEAQRAYLPMIRRRVADARPAGTTPGAAA